MVIKAIISQNHNKINSLIAPIKIFEISIKKYQTKANKLPVDISKRGYTELILSLQYPHLHKFFSQENTGIKSFACRVVLHFPQ